MKTRKTDSLPALFLLVRLVMLLSLPIEGLAGYGDLGHFYGWARLDGWPLLDYWMEFPPVFPMLAEILYRLAGGREHTFYYLLAVLFTAAQAGSLALFQRIARQLNLPDSRSWLYFALLAGLFYGWTYFDPLAVLASLLGLYWALQEKPGRAAAAFAVGGLVKWFPVLGLGLLLKTKDGFRLKPVMAGAAILAAVWAILFLISPDYVPASFRSQGAKGSWESPWALLDGNLGTGNFGSKEERYDPALALVPQGNPPTLSPWLALIPFAAAGLALFLRADLSLPRSKIAFFGASLVIFFLWSPGWSPQWALYLLPLILLLLPGRTAVLMALVLLLVNLLEWPLLLSRGIFQGLYLTVALRTLLLLLLGFEFWRIIPTGKK